MINGNIAQWLEQCPYTVPVKDSNFFIIKMDDPKMWILTDVGWLLLRGKIFVESVGNTGKHLAPVGEGNNYIFVDF